MTDPLLGALIGRYRVSYLLGEGGMGRVYAAEHDTIANHVAIKVMSSHSGEATDRFFAEARAITLVSHPAIVKVMELAQLPDGRPYIVMELVEGVTLRSLIRRGVALPVGGVIDVMIEVLSALGAVHAASIVHRDLKPDNIMITPAGRVRVLDFGIAKLSAADAIKRTQTGVQIGTPEYMAPEQIRGSGVDARTDLYSAGVVLFEAVTGQRPFVAESEFELMRLHLEGQPRSICIHRPELGPELDNVIAQALAKSPSDRFRSAAAMANALSSVRETLRSDQLRTLAVSMPLPSASALAPATEVSTSTPGPGQSSFDTVPSGKSRRRPPETSSPVLTSPASGRRAVLAIVGVVVVLAAIVAIGLYVRTNDGAPPTTGSGSALVESPRADARGTDLIPTIIGPTQPTPNFDPGNFDPLAYMPQMRALARETMPDAELAGMMMMEVQPTGMMALSVRNGSTYMFRSRAGVAAAAGERMHCLNIYVTSAGPSVLPLNDTCGLLAELTPHCSLVDVFAHSNPPVQGNAMILWVNGTWEVTEGKTSRFVADTCAKHADAGAPPGGGAPPSGKKLTPAVVPPTPTPTPTVGAGPGAGSSAHVATRGSAPSDVRDPSRFDALGYIREAQQRARAVFPDAILVAMELESVHADGHVDLTHRTPHGRGADRYEFWSPSHIDTDTVHPSTCRVIIDVHARSVDVTVDRPGVCKFDRVRGPVCSLVTIWNASIGDARERGLGSTATFAWTPGRWNVTATIGENGDNTWADDILDGNCS